ncbi:MAG: glycogen debranching protein GlgX, partial [Aeromonas sp.]
MLVMEAGQSYPLGARLDDTGCHFCVWAPQSDKVELCLFDEQEQEHTRLALPGRHGQYRFGYVRGVQAGQRYGYRVYGTSQEGMLFDPQKLLIDPYAKALSRPTYWDEALYQGDSAPMRAKSVVIDDRFDWQGVGKPHISPARTILY